ncbi:MAG: L-seryl-tRNA(Sec) selenium transferase [Gemmatimonadetes bacterium]|nr:L-seryl-tRNA(Sec) selenium transferase [Gemmatimonadota bacterium]
MTEPRPSTQGEATGTRDPRREIPAVERLLGSEPFAPLLRRAPRRLLLRAVHAVQEDLRKALALPGRPAVPLGDFEWYAARVEEELEALQRGSLRPVINATGVVLHTNLGRAPLAPAARAAVERVAGGYTNLEYDLDAGERGSRYVHCVGLLSELTGAEDALVVNNNAAAVVLALNTLAEGKEAVISRGELIEIGGSFRIPDIMAKSGARMVEVGTTNKTHRVDYELAVGPATGAIMKVHRSNFRMTGFTSDVPLAELVRLGRERGVPVLNDLGSGLLLDLTEIGLPGEPTAQAALEAGADVVTMSGDKLLGGPQAGIVLGRADLLARMRKNPLCRALRVDKLTLAALEATLALYRDPDAARREVPVLRSLALTPAEIGRRAAPLAERLRAAGMDAELAPGMSAAGGGAFPDAELPTTLLLVRPRARSANEAEARLRAAEPPIIARIVEDRIALDLRTVFPEEEEALLAAVRHAAE